MKESLSRCECGAGTGRDAGLVPFQPDAAEDEEGGTQVYQHMAFQGAGQEAYGGGGEGTGKA